MLDQITLDDFPQTGVSLTFAYGSRILKQGGIKHKGNDLVDIIFVVDDTIRWHEENLRKNEIHYSAIRYLNDNASRIAHLQENFGARIYFNPYVDIAGIAIKYGIINTKHLIDDLMNWTDLYVAGRLHKPVEFLINKCDKNESLKSALRFNKESAIRAALLQLPESFEPLQLYTKIAGHSYHGDPRMLFGEDKDKIHNIVHRQVERFDQLYLPIIKMSQSFKDLIQFNDSKRILTQDLAPNSQLRNLKLLPRNVRRRICETYGREARTVETDAVLTSLAKNINRDKIVGSAIAAIVRRSSLSQSFKGLFTAGLLKSIKYSHRKLRKSLVSRLIRNE